MAPEVEHYIRILKSVSAEGARQIPLFVVDLSARASFDPKLFDAQLVRISPEPGVKKAKFVVIGNQMLIFPNESGMHATVYRFSPSVGIYGILQCAGSIKREITKDGTPVRTICDYSSSLEDEGLSPADSDRFKQTVLSEKFGEYFTIE